MEKTQIGVDIGGTFTDIVVSHNSYISKIKVLSTPSEYSKGVMTGLSEAINRLKIPPENISEIVHATTLATNAILEKKGANCCLITTKGFRDVLDIGRLRIPTLYDPFYDKRKLLIPRHNTLEINERIGSKGEIIEPFSIDSMKKTIDFLDKHNIDSAAICLINSYRNSTHEDEIAKEINKYLPNIDISLSSKILPHIGEYERMSSTVIDAYIKPIVRNYLRNLKKKITSKNIEAPIYIMKCSGGLTTLDHAEQIPINMIESGPAAGVLAASHFLNKFKYQNLVTFDMGGTTAKASIIENGKIFRTRDYEVGGQISATSRLTGGGGYPINIPVVDIAEVGAGGGSIGWIDTGKGIKVGPKSAGAQPGPACYGLGGKEPTVTDANVILGYLNPEGIAGGEISISHSLAERAIVDNLSKPLKLNLESTAYGMHLIANSQMMGAIRSVTTQRGRDVRDFTLIAFGGSGPVHASSLAKEMGIPNVVVPNSPGVFSAFGLTKTDITLEKNKIFYEDIDCINCESLLDSIKSLREELLQMLSVNEKKLKNITYELEADLHYLGQRHDLTVKIPQKKLNKNCINQIKEVFSDEYENTYGQKVENEKVILVEIRVILKKLRHDINHSRILWEQNDNAVKNKNDRKCFFGKKSFLDTPVIGRSELKKTKTKGPLLIEEYDSVTVVPPNCKVSLDSEENIHINIS